MKSGMKMTACLLAVLMIVSLVAGCASTPPDNQDTTNSATTTTGVSNQVVTDNTTMPPTMATGAEKVGYAAVGAVNAAKNEAAVLLGDGSYGTVSYTGTAPKMGAVHKYKMEDDKFIFTYLTGNTHLPTPSDQLTGAGCKIRVTTDGCMWTKDAGVMTYRLGEAPIFIRYSAVEWRLVAAADIKKQDDSKYAVGSFFDVEKADDYADKDGSRFFTVGAVLLGNADANDLHPSDLTHFDNPQANVVLGTIKTVIITEPTKKPTSTDKNGKPVSTTKPVSTKKPQGVTQQTTTSTTLLPALQGNAPASGYAAVGAINASAKKATVLLGNGSNGTVVYTGTTPTVGAIHKYQRDKNGRYTFTLLSANTHLAQPTDQLTVPGCEIYATKQGYYMWTHTNQADKLLHYHMDNVPIFVRYSATEWGLLGIRDLAVENHDLSIRGYFYDVKRSSDYVDADQRRWHFVGALMLGSAGINKFIKPDLQLFGNPKATVILGATTTAPKPTIQPLSKPTNLAVPNYVTANADAYSIHADGGMIYNPISREANKTGTLNMYNGAATKTVQLSGSGYQATFTMPTSLVPYSAVPINYTIRKTGNVSFPMSIVATAFEESGRSNNESNTYDLSVPGNVAIDLDYLGYVTGTLRDGERHIMSPYHTDSPADVYPNYNLTSLTRSSTVKSGDVVWLKFKYTNTGNTILDAEGTGGFVIEPILQRRNPNGTYTDIGGIFNQYIRELTYVYPGESREFWLNFESTQLLESTPQGMGLTAGDYRVYFKTYYRTEYDYEPYTTMWDGYEMQTSTFDFKVANQASMTTPKDVSVISAPGANSKNRKSWLHYFEEFMTTYEQYRTDPGKTTFSGTIYVQPASFTKRIVLKVITGNGATQLARTAVAVTMRNDEVGLVYNPNNVNTVVQNDGLAWPAVQAQTMTDMRIGVSSSPYVAEEITGHLLDMKECGINLITNQGWYYLYDVAVNAEDVNLRYNASTGEMERRSNQRGDALKFTLDVIRRLGLSLDGMGMFYFASLQQEWIAEWIDKDRDYNIPMIANGSTEGDRSSTDAADSAAVILKYQRERWGDSYWSDKNGYTQYYFEDTGGYSRYEMTGRLALGSGTKQAFRTWLQKKYGTVSAMNSAWGTSYSSFNAVDPEAGLTDMNIINIIHMYDYRQSNTGFREWSKAVIDLDTFRTELRLQEYNRMLTKLREDDPSATVQIRTEGSNMLVPGLNQSTTNPHYRNIIYNQLRNGTIAELVAMSTAVRSYADYVVLPLTPSEVTETTKLSVKNGLIPMLMPQFNNMRDYAINSSYGEDFRAMYNLKSSQKGALVKSLVALFPWWKATYEAGGVPGILWQDLACDGVVTETQQKEIKFFTEKVKKMMADPSVKKQAAATKKTTGIKPIYSYDPTFVDSIIEKVKKAR